MPVSLVGLASWEALLVLSHPPTQGPPTPLGQGPPHVTHGRGWASQVRVSSDLSDDSHLSCYDDGAASSPSPASLSQRKPRRDCHSELRLLPGDESWSNVPNLSKPPLLITKQKEPPHTHCKCQESRKDPSRIPGAGSTPGTWQDNKSLLPPRASPCLSEFCQMQICL